MTISQSDSSDSGGNAASVSVVICTYTLERYDDLRAAVSSVEAQTVEVKEIIVAVDRNPELLDRIRSELPSVTAVGNRHHAGAGGARNSGVEMSSGEVLVFMDDDVVAERDWLERLLPALSDPSILGGGGTIDPAWATERPKWFPDEFDWVVGCTYRGMPTEVANVRNVISANMAVKREVFELTGGFRSDFGKQGDVSEPEETEFCIRALERHPGANWVFVPGATVHHRVTPERETWRYFLARCKNEGTGKASMAGHVQSSGVALETERRYVRRVLPMGVIRGLGEAIHGDINGLRRAAAITIGFSMTALSYLSGRTSQLIAARARVRPAPAIPPLPEE